MLRCLWTLTAFLAISAPALAAERDTWETITSREGGFTVDMPAKPTTTKSRTRQTREGLTRIFFIGCVTDRGSYLAFRIDLPINMPRGIEERVLDSQRDFFAELWNGRLVTEKRVRAQGNAGRDFTIRGDPERLGTSTIRVREYLAGRSVFAVAVISPANRGLPEDAGRFLGSMALGEARTRAAGTPEPEAPGTELRGWGLLIDPDRDCQFTPGDRSIAINVPGALHDLSYTQHKLNAPRVMREVDGDFLIAVKVAGEFRPQPPSTNPLSIPYNGAGILIWSDSENHIRLERSNMERGGRFTPQMAFIEAEGGYPGANHSENIGEGPCYLRVERRGSRILAAFSGDGLNWKALQPIDTVWPEKLKVGLTAISTSSTPFLVKFEEFDLRAAATAPPVAAPPVAAPTSGGPRPLAPAAPTTAPSTGSGSPPASSGGPRLAILAIVVIVGIVMLVVAATLVVGAIWLIGRSGAPARPGSRAKSPRRAGNSQRIRTNRSSKPN